VTDSPPLHYRPDIKAILDHLLPNAFPGVRASRAFGYPAYKVEGRIFAFVGGDGLSLKLGEAAVRRLSAQGGPYSIFEVGEGVVWKAWLSIDHADAAAYEDELQLFADSVEFVREGR
jgi:hypothetical protein